MRAVTFGLTLTAALAAGAALAQDAGLKVGVLTCKATDIDNFVLFTDTNLQCVYESANGENVETYKGDIDQIGVNLSIKEDVTLVWTVVAPAETEFLAGQLEGTYVGASADAALGIGVGANVLVGGGEDSFALQPVSVEGIEGFGVSIGIESFELESTG